MYYPVSLDFFSSLASVFALAGLYILYYSGSKFSGFIAGLLFSLSLLSKISTIPLVLLIILLCFFTDRKSFFKKIVQVASAMLALFFVAWLLFPNIYPYQFVPIFFFGSSGSLWEAIFHLFNPFGSTFFAMQNILLIFFSLYCLLKTKKYPPLLFMLSFIIVNSYYNYTYTELFFFSSPYISYYFAPFMPFLILSILLVLNIDKSDKMPLKFLLIAIAALFISSTMLVDLGKLLPSNMVYKELSKAYSAPYDFANFAGSDVLVVDKEYLFKQKYYPQNINITYDSAVMRADEYGLPRLTKAGLVQGDSTYWIKYNLENPSFLVKYKNKEISENVVNLKYDIIFAGPDSTSDTIATAFFSAAVFTDTLNVSNYCRVDVPNIEDYCPNCNQWAMILFPNWTQCVDFANKTYNYYLTNYEYFCSYDRRSALGLSEVMFMLDSHWNKFCKKGGNYLDVLYSMDSKVMLFVFLSLFFMLSYSSYYYLFRHKNIILVFILLVVLTIFLVSSIYILSSSYLFEKSMEYNPIISETNYSNILSPGPMATSSVLNLSNVPFYFIFLYDNQTSDNITNTIRGFKEKLNIIGMVDLTELNTPILSPITNKTVLPLLYCKSKQTGVQITGTIDDYAEYQLLQFMSECKP
jgi:hypothetical protein